MSSLRRVPVGPLMKFTAFTVVTAMATVLLGMTIANTQAGSRTTYSARFTDSGGLLEGDDVRIAGVVVGSVSAIRIVDRTQAEVDFSVDSALRIPATASAAVLYKNLIGQRFLALRQGEPGDRTLAPGDTIPVERTTPPLDLTVLFNGFKPLFTALDPEQVDKLSQEIVSTLQGEGGTVTSLLASTASLTRTIADRDEVIGRVIDNLDGVLATVDAHDHDLARLIGTLRALVSGLAADREPIGRALDSVGELADVTAGLVDEARPPLRHDITALGDLAGQLDTARPTLERLLQTTPGKLATLSRAASYGSWFQFYLCGLSGSVGLGDLVPRQEIPAFKSDAPRCGPDPAGTAADAPPVVPGVPPAVAQLTGEAGAVPPSGAPALPLFAPIGGAR